LEQQIHGFGIFSHFLFITRDKSGTGEIGKQGFNLNIGELCTFNPSG